jgi:hypothetical protein
VLSAAACSKVSGGTSRVFVRPGVDAFAMIAMPQRATAGLSLNRFASCMRCQPPKSDDPARRSVWQLSATCQSIPAHCRTSQQTIKGYELHEVVIAILSYAASPRRLNSRACRFQCRDSAILIIASAARTCAPAFCHVGADAYSLRGISSDDIWRPAMPTTSNGTAIGRDCQPRKP